MRLYKLLTPANFPLLFLLKQLSSLFWIIDYWVPFSLTFDKQMDFLNLATSYNLFAGDAANSKKIFAIDFEPRTFLAKIPLVLHRRDVTSCNL